MTVVINGGPTNPLVRSRLPEGSYFWLVLVNALVDLAEATLKSILPAWMYQFRLALLAEKLQHALRDLIGLTKHCCASLLQDLVLGEVDHFLSHVGVTNT